MDSGWLPRRAVLAAMGVIGGTGRLQSGTSDSMPRNSRPNTSLGGNWKCVVTEDWKTFDTDRWSVGFLDREEWIPDDDATVSSDHVYVEDGICVLEIESRGTGPEGCYQGAINSGGDIENHQVSLGIPIDPLPGQYVEARLKLPGRTGVLPAFWMHPANRNWPPEIDIVELFQHGENPQRERQQIHIDVHWSESGVPNDMETHKHAPVPVDVGTTVTENFNRYGCAWFEDRIEWYFNGKQILARSSPPAMVQSMSDAKARPFGLIFSSHVNRIGEANLSERWTEQLMIDWVQVWELTE